MEFFDYIIIGGGAAGLSLADRFCDEQWSSKKILIIESLSKDKNDRTWTSWLDKKDRYSNIASKEWKNLVFRNFDGTTRMLKPDKYHYRMIQSADFYKYIHEKINHKKYITYLNASYQSFEVKNGSAIVHTDKGQFKCKHIFSSVVSEFNKEEQFVYVDQHFKGWFIETEDDFFDDQTCTFMDFNIEQNDEIRFMYVLPKSKRIALVELAIFSNNLLKIEEYDQVLQSYIEKNLNLKYFKILETEFGIIPMTSYNFAASDSHYVTHIGTSAGCVKPSSGYAFSRIQKHVDAIIECLESNIHPGEAQKVFKSRFKYYDSIMLNVLLTKKMPGGAFFEMLFDKSTTDEVFKYLDQETSLIEDVKLMNLPNKWPFIVSAVKTMIKL
jgi:lycopene beta-cyclase